jgi:predicted nucleic acid-binding Zn ribbon protein
VIYPYVCDSCGEHVDLIRSVAQRDDIVLHDCRSHAVVADRDHAQYTDVNELVGMVVMRREIARPTVHYVGAGWTRTPSIMKDKIAKDHPGQRENWGVGSTGEYGDPNVITPYKHVHDADAVSAAERGEIVEVE